MPFTGTGVDLWPGGTGSKTLRTAALGGVSGGRAEDAWEGAGELKCSLLSRVRRCDPMDCSPPGSSIHGTSQARILQRVAISSSTGSSQPRDQTWGSRIGRHSLPLSHQGSQDGDKAMEQG